jgi:DNA polymerase
MDFKPEVWPEDPVPEKFKHCKTCGLYKQGTRMVWGEGNPNAPIMILLDNPGAREDRKGHPYVCGTRETLQRAAHQAGLKKEDLYVTYVLKRRPIRAYDKPSTRAICMETHLTWQLENQKPRLVFCLGNVAVQSFFKDPKAEIKTLRGVPHNIQGYPTFVAYHPLAVRRCPNLMSGFIEDWVAMARYIKSLR